MKINLLWIARAVAIALVMLGAVQVQDPESLGVSTVAIRWLGIISIGLGLLQTFLPRAQGPTKDPEELADRVWNLPLTDRDKVRDILTERGIHDA
jgi:hypothetical protein